MDLPLKNIGLLLNDWGEGGDVGGTSTGIK